MMKTAKITHTTGRVIVDIMFGTDRRRKVSVGCLGPFVWRVAQWYNYTTHG